MLSFSGGFIGDPRPGAAPLANAAVQPRPLSLVGLKLPSRTSRVGRRTGRAGRQGGVSTSTMAVQAATEGDGVGPGRDC